MINEILITSRTHPQLYLDFPGGGFICMNPLHHEERLRQLAKEVQGPILAIDYCKAPEYPYPFALEECFDVYRTLFETRGKAIGMSGSSRFRVILSGDSAGGNLATAVMLKILEYPQPHIKSAYITAAAGGCGSVPPPLPKPLSLILAYPSLNFSFTAWMKPEHLRVLKAQSEVNLQSLRREASDSSDVQPGRKGSPLRPRSRSRSRSRQTSLLGLSPMSQSNSNDKAHRINSATKRSPNRPMNPREYQSLASQAELHLADRARLADAESASDDALSPILVGERGSQGFSGEQPQWSLDTRDTSPSATNEADETQRELALSQQKADAEMTHRRKKAPVGTRLTMSSMSGYFQDRILTQSMMRAMAILYIGPRRQPDFDHDYLLSPVVAPARLLAEFPPVLFICGEKDPICDDTVIMAGRIREAKLAKQTDMKRRRAGVSSCFGEGLRMSVGTSEDTEADPIENEDVEDWVQMRIIASVSHGLLQMGALWPEAKHIISFIAAWTVEAFEDENERIQDLQPERAAKATEQQTSHLRKASVLSRAPSSGEKPPALQVGASPTKLDFETTCPASTSRKLDEAILADAEDDEEPLSFTPKRMQSPSRHHRGSVGLGFTNPQQSPKMFPAELTRSPKLPGGVTSFGRGGKAQSPTLSVVQKNGAPMRSRPSSFSDTQRLRKSIAADACLLPEDGTGPPAAPSAVQTQPLSPIRQPVGGSLRSSSFGEELSRDDTSAGIRGLAFSSTRRASRGPGGTQTGGTAAALDERTKALLVNEGHLLQRRRQEAVSGLGSSAIHSDSEGASEDGEGDNSELNTSSIGLARGRTSLRFMARTDDSEDGAAKSAQVRVDEGMR